MDEDRTNTYEDGGGNMKPATRFSTAATPVPTSPIVGPSTIAAPVPVSIPVSTPASAVISLHNAPAQICNKRVQRADDDEDVE